MRKSDHDNAYSPHALHMKAIAQRVREINQPKLLGDPPSSEVQRSAYIFTQTIRSHAERNGVQYHSLDHFVVAIQGSPRIPKPKDMAGVLAMAQSYIVQSEATMEAPEITLLTDDCGKIVLSRSQSFPCGFSFRFAPAQDGA